MNITYVMRQLSLVLLFVLSGIFVVSAQKKYDFYLDGYVKEAVGKTDLVDALVIRRDNNTSLPDTIRMSGLRYRNGEEERIANFYVPVERKDTTYVFDVVCEGYTPYTLVYDLKNIGKRERYRSLPTVYLKRAPRMLDEVTVTTSKIKFYNKGDTIVFNADAFQLAEGSMLDALIAQLPGVELNDNGQIRVNGEFVESLLLNGKQFLDGNNQLMLENIGAYTVKNIEVYKGQTPEEKWRNDGSTPKHLTMDVKLKKEYNFGWIINAQGGAGTKERYYGRLFASWFSPTTTVALMGNVNNLNDNRQPGKNDSWTPEMMPSGTKTYRMGALDYNYESPDRDRRANGKFIFQETRNNNFTTTARTNFLSGGNTFDNSYDKMRDRETKIDTDHYLSLLKGKYRTGVTIKGRYKDRDNSSSNVSATFDTEQLNLSMKAIEAMYSDGSEINLNSVINRSINRTDGSRRDMTGQIFPYFEWKIPKTNDHLLVELGVSYTSTKEERWKDYNINYGANPVPVARKRQYFDNNPNHSFRYNHILGYRFKLGEFYFNLEYDYFFKDTYKDSYMYALDRLADMGIYGTLPGGYLETYDPANSYTSRSLENKHIFEPSVQYHKVYNDTTNFRLFNFCIAPQLELRHTHFDYMRAGKQYLVKRTDFIVQASGWDARFHFHFNGRRGEKYVNFRNQLSYNLTVTPRIPDPVDMIDIVNDTDPLNIFRGNPDLKVQYQIDNKLSWTYQPTKLKLNNTLTVNQSVTQRALTKGYTYDTSTGIRNYRTYNTSGNSSLGLSNSLRYQFGPINQFTLSSITDLTQYSYGDMIGVNLSEPVLSKVQSLNFNEKLTLSWEIGKQMLQLRGAYTNRHTTSSREGFATINADHYNFGLTGQFKLPAGFGISTDFTVYTRRGYGVKELDTSDAIWNMRLTWVPTRNKHWVFMVDGFDMLHQLSNVNYAISATGRTVSYSNALPRYILFSVQYRLNLQPKKRK